MVGKRLEGDNEFGWFAVAEVGEKDDTGDRKGVDRFDDAIDGNGRES